MYRMLCKMDQNSANRNEMRVAGNKMKQNKGNRAQSQADQGKTVHKNAKQRKQNRTLTNEAKWSKMVQNERHKAREKQQEQT